MMVHVELQGLKEQIQELLDNDFIRQVFLIGVLQFFLLKKKTDLFNYTLIIGILTMTIKNKYRVSQIKDLFDQL